LIWHSGKQPINLYSFIPSKQYCLLALWFDDIFNLTYNAIDLFLGLRLFLSKEIYMTAQPPTLYTIREAAEILRCSTKTIRRQIARGHLLATKPKGLRTWLIPETALKGLLNQGVPDGH
jgi:excisionase family DNA binding protein